MKFQRYSVLLIIVFLIQYGHSAPIWPNWKYDRQLTGRCPYYGPDRDILLWSFSTPDTFSIRSASPVIGEDGTVYFSSPDSFIFAVRPNGTEKWRYKIGNCVPGGFPAIDQRGRLYFNTTDSRVVAIDDSGTYAKLAWQRDCSDSTVPIFSLTPVVVGSDRTVYVSLDSLYAIDSLGNRKWAYNTGLTNGFPPAISLDGSYLYYEYCSDPFTNNIAKRRTDGTLIWTHYIGGAPGSLTWASPCIGADSTIYFAANDAYLHAIMPNNTDKWAPVSLTGAFLYVTVSLGINDTIWLMNRQKRPVYWKFSPTNGSEVLKDSITYTPSRYNLYNSFITDVSGRAFIALIDSGTYNLTLYVFESNGTLNRTYTIPLEGRRTNRTFPAMAPGRFYLVGGNKLYAFQGGSIGVKETEMSDLPVSVKIFPNPFCTKAEIKITPTTTSFFVKIYDSAGRLVRDFSRLTTYDRRATEFIWDGTDNSGIPVKSGVYFCRVEGPKIIKTEKLVLIRER
ncbi:MAG: T9SS type A sorting domain-containing protein [candidate division WOR-3 bacterium]